MEIRNFVVLLFCCCFTCAGHSNEEQNSNFPPQKLVVSLTYGAGFFAELQKVLNSIIHYSKQNLKSVYVDWTGEFFPYKETPHENGWDLYFEPIEIASEITDSTPPFSIVTEGTYHEIHDFPCIDQWKNYDQYLDYRLSVNEIMSRYIKIKPAIIDKLNQFVSERMAGYYCIGVHIRYGSDHGSEAPCGVPLLEDYIAEVERLVAEHKEEKVRIYLATDSQHVVKEFQRVLPKRMLLMIDTYRTKYRDVPHLIYGNGDYWLEHEQEFHEKKPGYFGGEGVLLDALLLSRCDVFVHSSSNIASFVSYYNPYIHSVYLPKTTETWPCRFGK